MNGRDDGDEPGCNETNQGKHYKPTKEVCAVIESHHLHSLARLGLLLGGHLGCDIVEWNQVDDHEEEWEVLGQLLDADW